MEQDRIVERFIQRYSYRVVAFTGIAIVILAGRVQRRFQFGDFPLQHGHVFGGHCTPFLRFTSIATAVVA